MLSLFAINLPCAFALGFLIVHLLRKGKSVTQWLFIVLLAMLAWLYFSNILYMTANDNMRMLMYSITMKHFVSPALPMTGILYLNSIMGERIKPWNVIMWMTLPLLCFVTIVVFNSFIGMDKLTQFLRAMLDERQMHERYGHGIFFYYQLINIKLYYGMIWLECLFLAAKAWHIMHMNDFTWRGMAGFLLHDGRMSPINVQCLLAIIISFFSVIRTFFGRNVFVEMPWLAVMLSVIVAVMTLFFAYVALYTNIKEVTLGFVFSPVEEGLQKSKHVEDKEFVPIRTMESDLLQRFNALMDEKQPYRNPELKLEDVAAMLGTNRLYMSRLVNGSIGMTFTDYMNKLRIELAMEYMQSNPTATQDDIAAHCGFSSAQSFSRRFKLNTSETPLQWLSKNPRKS